MRVVICDDSALMRTILKDFFGRHGVEVAGEAANGKAAVEKVEQNRPDLVIMDIDMPIMNGIEATTELMRRAPVPIVIFTAEITDQISFAAFKAGAADVVRKPDLDRFYDHDFTEQLIGRFQAVTRPSHTLQEDARPVTEDDARPRHVTTEMVVLGASTGGPVAVKTVLGGLPADFPAGIAIVQHIEARFAEGYACWLDGECALHVRLAAERDQLEPGTVLVAPGDRHLVATVDGLLLDDGPKVGSHRPAVDRLFETAAAAYRNRLAGVLLTGMGKDGAAGCLAIKRNGGFTIVQDQATSSIYGMPKAAAEMGGATVVKPLGEIARALQEVCRRA